MSNFSYCREAIIKTKWLKLKKRVAVRYEKLLELSKLVGSFRDIEDVEGTLRDLQVRQIPCTSHLG